MENITDPRAYVLLGVIALLFGGAFCAWLWRGWSAAEVDDAGPGELVGRAGRALLDWRPTLIMSRDGAEPTASDGVVSPVAATQREAGQLIATPSTGNNAELPDNAPATIPTEARDAIRAAALEQGKAMAVAELLKSGKLTNKAEAIERVFGCSRSSREGSPYQRALAIVDPLLTPAPKYRELDADKRPVVV